jgi:hypothetical protein
MSILFSLFLIQATAAAPQAASQPNNPSDDAKIVCKTVNTTGSRLGGKRMCNTKKEWRRLNEEAEKTAREIQDGHSKQPGNQ